LEALDTGKEFKLSVVLSEKNMRLIDKISKIPRVNIIKGPSAYPLNIFLFLLNIRRVMVLFDLNDIGTVDLCVMNLPGIEFNLAYVFYCNRKKIHTIAWLHRAERLSDLIVNVNVLKKTINILRDVLAEKFVFNMYKMICLPTNAEKNVLVKRLATLTDLPVLGVLNNVVNGGLLLTNDIIKHDVVNSERTTIIVIGEIDFATKGQDRTIGIAVELIKRGIRPYFIFVGSGADSEALSERFINADLHDHFQLVGWQPDISKWLQMASIVLITSRTESFSLVALEAMAMTKKIVASRLPCFDEVLPVECISLSEAAESFSDAIEKLLSFERSYIENLYAPLIDKFSPNEFVKSVKSFFYTS
jgi:glycosyltransferase involved in cell wall biosynthesis